MTTNEALSPVGASDAELVADSLRGDRDSFGQIVARYQSLVCSVAYSSTGSLTQSEDLAQETFVTAWTQLSGMREPAKLRSWLCGIVRNLSHRAIRERRQEPLHEAASLETLDRVPALEPHPLQQAIGREEEAILWLQLAKIPEIYREPLILFYRQDESIEQVARALELSEDAVRQRLVRGRKLLHEQVLAFVEGALGKTAPRQAFTQGVLAALPIAALPAKATAVGAMLAGGGSLAKGALTTAGSVGSGFAMLGGAYAAVRAEADDTKSPRERKFVLPLVGLQIFLALLLMVAIGMTEKLGFPRSLFARDSVRSAAVFLVLVLGIGLARHRFLRQRQIQIEEGTFDQAEWESPRRETDSAARRSGIKADSNLKKIKRLALPLVIFVVAAYHTQWKQHLLLAVLVSVLWPLLFLFVLWRSEQSRSRFASRPPIFVVVSAIIVGAFTLFAADSDFYKARIGTDRSQVVSPIEMIAFHLLLISAYVLLVGYLVRRRRPWPLSR